MAEMGLAQVKLNDLPVLPFEQILSQLSLEDQIRSREVSRRWRKTIDSFEVNSLFYSTFPLVSIIQRSRLVSGERFAQNFICSPRFETLGKMIFSNLKHLRLYGLSVNAENGTSFTQLLSSFGQLEELDLIQFNSSFKNVHFRSPSLELELNLPTLHSIQLEDVNGIKKLTLDTPRLKNIKIWNYEYVRHFYRYWYLSLELVHAESVERLFVDQMGRIAVERLKNLRYLCCRRHSYSQLNDSTFLSHLKQLQQIHLYNIRDARIIVHQKEHYLRVDLEVYIFGLLLNGPDDPAFRTIRDRFTEATFRFLAENQSKPSNEIPFYARLQYDKIETIPTELAFDFLNRFTDLNYIIVARRVQDIQRFLDLLKSFPKVTRLRFMIRERQDLFDRLHEHCAVQFLSLYSSPSYLGFLSKLEHLSFLDLEFLVDVETAPKVLKELQFLSKLNFRHLNWQRIGIEIKKPKRSTMSPDSRKEYFSNPEDAIQFIIERTRKDSK